MIKRALKTLSSDTKEMPSSRPFGVFERLVAWRYLRSKRKETVVSVIAGFSFAGIMLGVAVIKYFVGAITGDNF